MGRQVMYYLVGSAFVLDQGLIERGCDRFFLSCVKKSDCLLRNEGELVTATQTLVIAQKETVTQLFCHAHPQAMSTVYFEYIYTLIHYSLDSCGMTCSPSGAVLSTNNPEHKSIGNVSGPQGAMF